MMESKELTLHRISLQNVSAFLLFRPGVAILVDCGKQGSEVKIFEEMTLLGLQPGMLKLLILTHAHYDHAGSAGRMKELTGCRIMIQRSDASHLEAGFTPFPSGTRWKARLVATFGRIFARRLMKYPPALADILVEESFELAEYGFPGRAIHTPGHTFGSMVILMEDGKMLAGDTLIGLPGKRIFPAFAEDPAGLLLSWGMISEMEVDIFYPAHGRSISKEKFLEEFSTQGTVLSTQ
ncbi:MAG: MBL fold metallo-hydrolase [Bacteroidetes bacterium]|nr:MBL fold metallo-hydrolase [Bacteroidota bacterium]